MKKRYVILLVFIIFLIAAILTNPSQDRHREIIKSKIKSHVERTIKEYTTTENPWEKFGQALGMAFVGVIVDKLVDNLITSDNYVLFSLTKVKILGETRVIGIGIFGKVFIFKDLKDIINDFKIILDNEKKNNELSF